MKLNLKDWKKIEDNDSHTILRNKDNHELKIAKKSLSKSLKSQLSDLPHFDDGGTVAPNLNPDKLKTFQANSVFNSQGEKPPTPEKPAQLTSYNADDVDHTVQKKAEGGAIDPLPQSESAQDSPEQIAADASQAPALPQATPQSSSEYIGSVLGHALRHLASGVASDVSGGVKKLGSDINSNVIAPIKSFGNAAMGNDEAPPTDGTPAKLMSADGGEPQPPQPVSNIPPTNDQAQPADAAPSQDPGQQQPMNQVPDPNAGFGMGMKAADIESKAQQQQAQTNQNLLQHQYEQERSFQASSKEHLDEIQNQSQALIEDINNSHIDPNKFLGDMGTPKRLATGIGLILGGIGSGLTHGPNMALEFLNKQIDRDIESQQANLNNKHSLLSANMQQYHNVQDAANVTRVQMAHMFANQLDQAAAAAGTPLAQARALQAKSALIQQYYPLAQQTAMRQAMMSMASRGGTGGENTQYGALLRVMNPEAAKVWEEHTVPGTPGQSAIPITADNRNDIFAKTNFDRKLNDYIGFAQNNSGSLDPRTIAVGKAKAAELQGLYRQATHGGVYKEGESKFIEQLIDSDPTKFANNLRGVIPKAQALKESNTDSLNTLKSSLGFQDNTTAPAQLMSAQKSLPQTATRNGVPYKLVNGNYVRVK